MYMPSSARNVTPKNMSASLLEIDRRTAETSLGVRVAEAVADAAHRQQVLRVLWVPFELLAQMPDVDVDRAGVAVRRVAPDTGQEHVPGEDSARCSRQRRQDLELDVGQLCLGAADPDRAFAKVDPQVAEHEGSLVGRGLHRPAHLRTPERRLDPARELPKRERLGDVVVGAEL